MEPFRTRIWKNSIRKNKCCGISGLSDPEARIQSGKLVSGAFSRVLISPYNLARHIRNLHFLSFSYWRRFIIKDAKICCFLENSQNQQRWSIFEKILASSKESIQTLFRLVGYFFYTGWRCHTGPFLSKSFVYSLQSGPWLQKETLGVRMGYSHFSKVHAWHSQPTYLIYMGFSFLTYPLGIW